MTELFTLGIHSILDTPKAKLKKLLEYYLYSNKSQSVFYKKYISSLKYDLSTHDTVTTEVLNTIETSITDLLGRYFNDPEVTVQGESKDGILYISIRCAVVENNQRYSIDRRIELSKDIVTVDDNRYWLEELKKRG